MMVLMKAVISMSLYCYRNGKQTLVSMVMVKAVFNDGDDEGCHWHVYVLLQEWETDPGVHGDDEGCHWHVCVLLQEWETDPGVHGDDEGCHWHVCVLLQEWETDPGVSMVMMKAAGEKAFCAGGVIRGGNCSASVSSFFENFFIQFVSMWAYIHTPGILW